MKITLWRSFIAVLLALASIALYFLHYLIFGDLRHIMIYLVGDLAFLPIQILIVTLLITQMLSAREKRLKLQKLNMVIDAFFSEVGRELLRSFVQLDRNASFLGEKLQVKGSWKKEDFRAALLAVQTHKQELGTPVQEMGTLKTFLKAKRDFLLSLLENPNILEHDRFASLLWSVCHLMEELGFRPDLSNLPQTDLNHLAGDMNRAYKNLVETWLAHLRHLQQDYPYLFSLAARTNPFDPGASVVITGKYS